MNEKIRFKDLSFPLKAGIVAGYIFGFYIVFYILILLAGIIYQFFV